MDPPLAGKREWGLVHTLHTPSDAAHRVIMADSWNGHASWRDEEWVARRTWMWYKHICRVVRAIFRISSIPCMPCPVARVWGRIPPRRVALAILAAATAPQYTVPSWDLVW